MSALPVLPCFPCPHASACCRYGTTVTDEEGAAIRQHHGENLVYQTRWGEWRTRIRQGYCVFHAANRCALHDKPYYPAVCRGFPFTDAETGGPYLYDQTICPEFIGRRQSKGSNQVEGVEPVEDGRRSCNPG
ncbi:MAG TPA: YkgJ family cysteine cluster protein [Gemmatimonadales bacterium]